MFFLRVLVLKVESYGQRVTERILEFTRKLLRGVNPCFVNGFVGSNPMDSVLLKELLSGCMSELASAFPHNVYITG